MCGEAQKVRFVTKDAMCWGSSQCMLEYTYIVWTCIDPNINFYLLPLLLFGKANKKSSRLFIAKPSKIDTFF